MWMGRTALQPLSWKSLSCDGVTRICEPLQHDLEQGLRSRERPPKAADATGDRK